VNPGILDTEFVTKGFDDYPNFPMIANGTPLKRIATVEDIAATVEALTTLIRFVTGIVIYVDGGKTL
jgi:NAD(P)-dependent dehydrogenase (short-subunit alcohol dehydrogenase family)